MLSSDLTRSQSELYVEWRRAELESPIARLWAALVRRRRGRKPVGQVERLPRPDAEPQPQVTHPAA